MSRPSPEAVRAYRRHCLRGALLNAAVACAWAWVGVRFPQCAAQSGFVIGVCTALVILWVQRGWSR